MSMIIIKSKQEIELMREAGKVNGYILSELERLIRAGHVHSGNRPVCGKDRKGLRHDSLRKGILRISGKHMRIRSTKKWYTEYRAPKRFLKEGDIVSLDLVVEIPRVYG